nr:MAG TPA: hypothetical protein [Caudoviricetes sp.]
MAGNDTGEISRRSNSSRLRTLPSGVALISR